MVTVKVGEDGRDGLGGGGLPGRACHGDDLRGQVSQMAARPGAQGEAHVINCHEGDATRTKPGEVASVFSQYPSRAPRHGIGNVVVPVGPRSTDGNEEFASTDIPRIVGKRIEFACEDLPGSQSGTVTGQVVQTDHVRMVAVGLVLSIRFDPGYLWAKRGVFPSGAMRPEG